MENQLKDAVIVAYGRSVVGKSGKKDVFRDVHKVDFVLKGVLEKVYPMVFLAAIHYHVRENNIVVKKAVYPKAEIQKCIIHQIRNSTKYVSYKDIKELMKDLKAVYKASTEELALTNLGIFEEKWDKKYPMCVSSWKNNWTELSTYFKYPEGIRKLVYTTNAMENFNRQLRKVTKTRPYFQVTILYKKVCI